MVPQRPLDPTFGYRPLGRRYDGNGVRELRTGEGCNQDGRYLMASQIAFSASCALES